MRIYAPGVLAVVLAGLVVWSYIYFKELRPVGTQTRLVRMPEVLLTVEDVKLAGRSNGKPIWRLDAKKLMVSQNRAVTTFEGIHDGAIYKGGKPAASIRAGRATYDSGAERFDAFGGVSIRTQDGTTLQTSGLSYSGFTKQLLCPNRVTISRKNSRGSVDRLVADLGNDFVEADNLRLKVATKDLEEIEQAVEKPR